MRPFYTFTLFSPFNAITLSFLLVLGILSAIWYFWLRKRLERTVLQEEDDAAQNESNIKEQTQLSKERTNSDASGASATTSKSITSKIHQQGYSPHPFGTFIHYSFITFLFYLQLILITLIVTFYRFNYRWLETTWLTNGLLSLHFCNESMYSSIGSEEVGSEENGFTKWCTKDLGVTSGGARFSNIAAAMIPFWMLSFIGNLLYCKYKQRIRKFFTAPCELGECEYVVVGERKSSNSSHLLPVRLCDSTKNRYFTYRCTRYTYEDKTRSFTPAPNPIREALSSAEILNNLSHGNREESKRLKLSSLTGSNHIDVEVPTIGMILLKEVHSYLYLWQWHSYLWVFYYYYWQVASIQYTITIFFLIRSARMLQKSRSEIRELAESKSKVRRIVKTNESGLANYYKEETISSETLVPGDLFIVEQHTQIMCDCVLIHGQAVMEESQLTGEPMPIQKFPIPDEEFTKLDFYGRHGKKHVLYSGTRVMQSGDGCQKGKQLESQMDSNGIKDYKVPDTIALVIEIGANTLRGKLIRDIVSEGNGSFDNDEEEEEGTTGNESDKDSDGSPKSNKGAGSSSKTNNDVVDNSKIGNSIEFLDKLPIVYAAFSMICVLFTLGAMYANRNEFMEYLMFNLVNMMNMLGYTCTPLIGVGFTNAQKHAAEIIRGDYLKKEKKYIKRLKNKIKKEDPDTESDTEASSSGSDSDSEQLTEKELPYLSNAALGGRFEIQCLSLNRILMAGRVDVQCLDKTGTLTEESLDFWGSKKVNINLDASETVTVESVPSFGNLLSCDKMGTQTETPKDSHPNIDAFTIGLATCHTVCKLNLSIRIKHSV